MRKPGSQDVAALGEEYGFHPLSLEDVVSRMQRPKVDVYDDYLFVVMHFPVHNKSTRTTHAAEVDFFIGSNYVITAHDGSLKPLARMFDNAMDSAESRARIMSQTTAHLLYYIVDRLVDYVFPIIDRLTDRVEEIEDDIFASTSPAVVQEISIVRRDLIALRRVVKPQSSIVSQLERRQWPLAGDDMDDYFGDIADHLGKIWDSLEDLKEVVEGLSATYDSLATHRLNNVIKTLTVISVIVLPLTLVTGIYGMNVPLPFESNHWTLIGLFLVMVLMTVAMLSVFRLRKWI